MVQTQLFYFVFTGCFFGACFTYENLDIVTLSGLDEVKGQAQQEAIRLATEDFLKEKGLSNATTHGFHFVFTDTQVCFANLSWFQKAVHFVKLF